ncbi:MAG: hypothetical protein PF637_00210 [Spirochaetes bacterium]|jgi:hypothetical protein|nr:hypothetical protein [Spirochaetota bacterium]
MVRSYKIVYLHKKILFPHGTLQIHAHSVKGSVLKPGETILVFTIRSFLDIFFTRKRYATVAKVTHDINSTGLPMVEIKGMGRATIESRESLYLGVYRKAESTPLHNAEFFADVIRKKAQEFVFLIDIPESERLIYLMTFITQADELIDFISHYFITDFRIKWRIYNQKSRQKRADMLIIKLNKLISDVRKKLEER